MKKLFSYSLTNRRIIGVLLLISFLLPTFSMYLSYPICADGTGGVLPNGVYVISNSNYQTNYPNYGAYYLRARDTDIVLSSEGI